MDKSNVLVIGPGAVGIGIAVLVARAGHNVQLLGRSGPLGNGRLSFGEVTREASFNTAEDFMPHLAIITSKAYDLKSIVANYLGIFNRCESVLCLQNGLGIRESVPELKNFVQGVLYVSAERRSVNEAYWWIRMKIVLDKNDPKSEKVGALLAEAGIDIDRTADFGEAVFRKLIINIALNPVSTIYRYSSKQIAENAPARERAYAAAREVQKIGEAAGVTFRHSSDDIVKSMLDRGNDFHSSMLQDLEANRPLEIETILEEPLRVAARNGIAVPEITSLRNDLMKR
ncbi:MAG TPA: 2-dehydropantoate 2-reductase [Bacteroidota bacterium]|nr:2-dehydropantoate 2-reductase [Bacteroidota bacterium]